MSTGRRRNALLRPRMEMAGSAEEGGTEGGIHGGMGQFGPGDGLRQPEIVRGHVGRLPSPGKAPAVCPSASKTRPLA